MCVSTQAEDRAHRIGQTKGLTIDYFVAEGTLDMGMWRNLQSKLNTVGRTVDGHVHGTATGLPHFHLGFFMCALPASVLLYQLYMQHALHIDRCAGRKAWCARA